MRFIFKVVILYLGFLILHECMHWLPAYFFGFNPKLNFAPIGIYISYSTSNKDLAIISIVAPMITESLLLLSLKSDSLFIGKCCVFSDFLNIIFPISDLRLAWGINPILTFIVICVYLSINLFYHPKEERKEST